MRKRRGWIRHAQVASRQQGEAVSSSLEIVNLNKKEDTKSPGRELQTRKAFQQTTAISEIMQAQDCKMTFLPTLPSEGKNSSLKSGKALYKGGENAEFRRVVLRNNQVYIPPKKNVQLRSS